MAGQSRTPSNVSAAPMSGCTMPWRGRPPGDEIGPGEVHLWRASHAATSKPPRLDCLDPAERQRARRMLMPSQRKAFCFARSMLRVVLGAYLSVDPERLRFATTAEGKPYLPGQKLRFNLSHSGDGVLLALVHGIDVGVDLEATGRNIDVDALAAASLSEAEWLGIDAIDEPERRRAILRQWTRKEALLKAEGSGLVYDPRDLTLPGGIAASTPARVRRGGRIWTLTDVSLGEAWQASLAIEGRICAIRGYCLGW
jgi:phosphopantetheinyl transferase